MGTKDSSISVSHTAGKYGGVCLAATSLDAKKGLFPLAICICRLKDYVNWKKFLKILEPHPTQHHRKLAFVSDRQKVWNAAKPYNVPEFER
ncbi:hypothetical protein BVC80_8351g8 [Macleaya cordata]|uniref:MULE transposase domain-containing protein n=1 Tax=Macleaya cordata TaxID=56857 RepID=A0A200QFS4_MACCD|nr:hypothetical protein BVC80_8351g8 [Macleaya cordata]